MTKNYIEPADCACLIHKPQLKITKMEMTLDSKALAMFKSFEINNPELIKGGDGDDENGDGIIGSDELGDI